STSGSHERYKSDKWLTCEEAVDCNRNMRMWLLQSVIAQEEEIMELEKEAKDSVRREQRRLSDDSHNTLQVDLDEALTLLSAIENPVVDVPLKTLQSLAEPSLKEIYSNVRRAVRDLRGIDSPEKDVLMTWYAQKQEQNFDRYNDKLFTDTAD